LRLATGTLDCERKEIRMANAPAEGGSGGPAATTVNKPFLERCANTLQNIADQIPEQTGPRTGPQGQIIPPLSEGLKVAAGAEKFPPRDYITNRTQQVGTSLNQTLEWLDNMLRKLVKDIYDVISKMGNADSLNEKDAARLVNSLPGGGSATSSPGGDSAAPGATQPAAPNNGSGGT